MLKGRDKFVKQLLDMHLFVLCIIFTLMAILMKWSRNIGPLEDMQKLYSLNIIQ